VEAGEELKCGKLTVLTWNREEKHSARGMEINFVPFWKWLIPGIAAQFPEGRIRPCRPMN